MQFRLFYWKYLVNVSAYALFYQLNILYQKFSVGSLFDDLSAAGTILSNITDNKNSYINPNFETQIGIGWGRYFNKNKLHFSIDALYDFEIFFNQNMMRYLRDNSMFGIDANKGNLFLNGLILEFYLDF